MTAMEWVVAGILSWALFAVLYSTIVKLVDELEKP